MATLRVLVRRRQKASTQPLAFKLWIDRYGIKLAQL